MGNDIAVKRIARGKGYFNKATISATTDYPAGSPSVDMEGTVRIFEDIAPQSGITPATRRSNRSVTCVLVRNVSGVSLLPKYAVTWKAGYIGKRVDGYARVGLADDATAPVEVAGIVDEYWPSSGVPDGELFWLVIKGPTEIRMGPANEAADWAEGDLLLALTAAASTHSTTAGRLTRFRGTFTVTETTNGVALNTARRLVGKALSAKSSTATNSYCLAEINSVFVP